MLIPSLWRSHTPSVNALRDTVGSCKHTSVRRDTVPVGHSCDNWMVRFKLAIQYVSLLQYLHLHPSGPYVLCNSHSLDTLLSQFSLSHNLQLLLVNFENLPGGHDPVVCSRKELHGDFVAPEQTWPYGEYRLFNPDQQPGYYYTSDIWKVPDITKWLLGTSQESINILNYLATIHHRCKSTDYTWRPSAKEIVTEYERIWSALIGEFGDSGSFH